MTESLRIDPLPATHTPDEVEEVEVVLADEAHDAKGEVHEPHCLCWHVLIYNRIMGLERITIKPDVCGGEPTVRGMRITVSHILEMLAGGMTAEQILEDFPYLEGPDIDACLEYAARQAAHREVLLNK